MRLFIALNLSNDVKNQAKEIKNILKENSRQGKFVNEDYMHITIEFLGEIEEDKVDLIRNLMDEIEFKPFTLKLTKIGYFKRRDGNIFWIGMEKNDTLLTIHDSLHKRLKEKGFKIEDRDFNSHLTLGRRVKLKDGFDIDTLNSHVEKIEIHINSIDLMKSEFTDGKLRYSIIHSNKGKSIR